MSRGEKALLALTVALSATFIVLYRYRPSGLDDLWWTLKVGDHIRAEGDVPRTLLWTIDAIRDLPYVCHGWLGALLYSLVVETLGLDAVPLVPTLIGFSVFVALILLARQLGASWLLSVTVANLVLYPVLWRMICRVEVFGYLYAAVALNLIAAYMRTGRIRTLAWLVPLSLLWVNSHGSFPLLPALLLAVAAGLFLDAWRRAGFRRDALFASFFSRDSAVVCGTCLFVLATALLNPYGIDLPRRVFEQSRSPLWSELIEEWRPIHAGGSLPLRFALPACLAGAALLAGFRRLSFVSVLVVVLLGTMAVSAERHGTLFGMGTAFLLGDFAAGLRPGRRGRAAVGASLVVTLLAANVYAATTFGFWRGSVRPSQWITERGLEYIRDHVRGNVLNRYNLGGVLIYFAHPQVRVSMDSRADPYPPAYFQSWWRALRGDARETLAFVDRYDIDHILIDLGSYTRHFRHRLPDLEGFRLAYRDRRMVVLSRPDRPGSDQGSGAAASARAIPSRR